MCVIVLPNAKIYDYTNVNSSTNNLYFRLYSYICPQINQLTTYYKNSIK